MAVNKVILLGHVGKDPEIKYFDADTAVANFSLATSERGYKTRDGKDVPERTEWHNIVAWRGLAKLAEGYIKKGSQIYVEGKIRTRSYDDQTGQKRYVTEIFADTIQLTGKKPDGDSGHGNFLPVDKPAENVPTPIDDAFLQDANQVEDDLPF
ncbi:MAG: single-stranded DNA-binding protein [Marinilabiliaceae bacterium]|nr:single-stranded DNA-binding protein [Marinilabiliaceae bacterium]